MVCSSQVAGSTWSPPILIASQWSGADQENAKLEMDQEQMRIGSRGRRSWSDQGDSGSDQEERRKADDEGTRGSRSRNNWRLMVILSRAAVVRRQTDDWRTTSLPFATIPYHTAYLLLHNTTEHPAMLQLSTVNQSIWHVASTRTLTFRYCKLSRKI